MINPRTYEQLAARLIAAGEGVSLAVGMALKRYWQQLIRDPQNISDAGFKAAVAREIASWNKEAREWAEKELALAYIQGIEHADKELAMVKKLTGANLRQPLKVIAQGSPLLPRLPLEAMREIATATDIFDKYPDHRTFFGVFQRAAHYHLEGTDLQIMRASQDLARDAATKAGEFLFRDGDIYTRRRVAQEMLNEFSRTGVKAIRYRNGRMVSIDAYSEMVGRSLSGRCAMQASLNRYQEYGYDLLRVSAHFRACPLCSPWEGRILSHSGQSSKYPSLAEVTAAGLFHSNCAHDINPYIPGLSQPLEVRTDPAEQELVSTHGYHRAQEVAYEAQQRQRQIERQIRAWKRRELLALDSEEQARAHRRVLDWHAAQCQHLRDNPYLSRQYVREQIRRAH